MTIRKCDENCPGCKPVSQVAHDILGRVGGGNFVGWDWFQFCCSVEQKSEEEVDEETKSIMKGFFQVFGIEVVRDEETGRKILGVKVSIFGDVVVAYEDLSDLELEAANDVVRTVQLREALQRTMGVVVARFAQKNFVKYVEVFWERHRHNFGTDRSWNDEPPF